MDTNLLLKVLSKDIFRFEEKNLKKKIEKKKLSSFRTVRTLKIIRTSRLDVVSGIALGRRLSKIWKNGRRRLWMVPGTLTTFQV